MKDIPFFYYDILAKLIPGSLALWALYPVANKVPEALFDVFYDMGPWGNVIIPIVLLAAAYFMGAILDSLLRAVKLFSFISNWARESAFALYVEVNNTAFKDLVGKDGEKKNARRAYGLRSWQKLVTSKSDMFSHAHRFQAEAKMFLHSAFPVSVLSLSLGHSFRGAVILTLTVGLLMFLCWSCEERRWIQVFAFADLEQEKIKDERPDPLQKAVNSAYAGLD